MGLQRGGLLSHFAAHFILSRYMSDAIRPSKIGFIGLGNMGFRMCKNLIKKEYEVMVKDLSNDQENALAKEGAMVARSLKDLADFSDIIITMLPASHNLLEIYDPSKDGLIKYLKRGKAAIDCSTVDYSATISLGHRLSEIGISFNDSPVSGGVPAAEKGTLTFMVGGDRVAVKQIEPILSAMGSKIFHCGPLGSGQITKMCNNLLLAISAAGVSEIFNLGIRLGIDPNLLTSVINHSSGKCWVTEVYHPVPGILENVPSSNEYKAGFTSEMILKDIKIATNAAIEANCSLTLGHIVLELYEKLCKSGHNHKDFTFIYDYLKNLDYKM